MAPAVIGPASEERPEFVWALLEERGLHYGGYILLGALMAAALNAASNVLNQWTDLENDRINKPERPLPAGLVTIPETFVYFIVLYLLSLLAAYFVTPLQDPGLGFWERHQCFAVVLLGAFLRVL